MKHELTDKEWQPKNTIINHIKTFPKSIQL